MADQLWHVGIDIDQTVGKFQRVRGGETDTVNAINSRHHRDQLGQVTDGAVVFGTAISVDVLPQQIDFPYPFLRQPEALSNHIIHGPADLGAPGVRHDAVGAVFVAPLHDGNKRGRAIHTWLGQTVKLLNLRESYIHHGNVVCFAGVDHLRQAVQSLRAKHHIDLGCAPANFFTFLTGHTATDTDDQVRVFLFQLAPATELMEQFFLGFFPHRTGVDQQDIRLFGVISQLQGMSLTEQVCHTGRIVLVHLATMGLDIQFFAHFTLYWLVWAQPESSLLTN